MFGTKNGWERADFFVPGEPWRRAGEDQRAFGWTRPPWHDARRRRARGDPRAARDHRHVVVRQARGVGAGCARAARARVRQPDRPAGRRGRVHAAARRARRDRRRRDGDAARRRSLPRRHRRGRRRLGSRLARAQRRRRDRGRHRRARGDRDLGARGARRARGGDGRRRLGGGVPVPHGDATISIGGAPVLAQRITYVGELGFELYVAREWAVQVWDAIVAAAQPGAGRLPRARLAAAGEGLPLLRRGHHVAGHAVRGGPRLLRRAGQVPRARPRAAAAPAHARRRRRLRHGLRRRGRARRRRSDRPRPQRRLRLHRRAQRSRSRSSRRDLEEGAEVAVDVFGELVRATVVADCLYNAESLRVHA